MTEDLVEAHRVWRTAREATHGATHGQDTIYGETGQYLMVVIGRMNLNSMIHVSETGSDLFGITRKINDAKPWD